MLIKHRCVRGKWFDRMQPLEIHLVKNGCGEKGWMRNEKISGRREWLTVKVD